MKFLRIREWDRLQHYKHRNPPWIKLHRDFMRSPAWVTGDDASRALAIACMMLASETDNCIPFDPTYVQRAACLNSEPKFEQLIATRFLEVIEASDVLAERKHDASDVHTNATPERERETEIREESKCDFCNGIGTRALKAHPGREIYCHCRNGALLKAQHESATTGAKTQ